MKWESMSCTPTCPPWVLRDFPLSSGRRLHALERSSHFDGVQLTNLLAEFQNAKAPDGCIDRPTFVRILNGINAQLPAAFAAAMFDLFDSDRSGTVDFKELVLALSLVQRGTLAERMRMCFETFDTDHTGFLEGDEITVMMECFAKVLPRSPGGGADIARRLEVMDTDGDGAISFHEFYRAASVDEDLLQAFGFGRDGSQHSQVDAVDAIRHSSGRCPCLPALPPCLPGCTFM